MKKPRIDKAKFSEMPDFTAPKLEVKLAPPPGPVEKAPVEEPRAEPPPPPVQKPQGKQLLSMTLGPKGKAVSGGLRIGRPVSSFTADELSCIDEQERAFIDQLQADPVARPLVNEVILCDIEMQRLDTQMQGAQDMPDAKDSFRLMKMLSTSKSEYLRRYRNAMDVLQGRTKTDDEGASTLTAMHKRYTDALDAMRKRGETVGAPSKEEVVLTKGEGLKAEHYVTPGTMPEAERVKVLEIPDRVQPSMLMPTGGATNGK